MNGTCLHRADRSPAGGALVGAWRVDDRPGADAPLALVRTGADGRFDLELPQSRGDVVVRVYLGQDPDTPDPRALVAVVQVPAAGPRRTVIWVDPADPRARRLFGRALAGGEPVAEGTTVTAADPAGDRRPQSTTIGRGGRFTLDLAETVPVLRLWLTKGFATLTADWVIEADGPEADVAFAEAGNYQVAGTLTRRADGSGIGGLRIELLDRSGRWPNPAGTASTAGSGAFTLTFPRLLDRPPEPTFAVWSGDERAAAVDWPAPWDGFSLRDVALELDLPPDQPVTYRLDGQALDRGTRKPISGLQVEVWTGSFDLLLKVTRTDDEGRFSADVRPDPGGTPPVLGLRLYRDTTRVAEQPVPVSAWRSGVAWAFCEVDLPATAPAVYRVSGRLIDPVTRSGVGGLRVEAWDKAPRPGGLLGAAAYAAPDGTFDLALPANHESTGAARPPALFFRLYARDVLVASLADEVSWGEAGTGVVVLEAGGLPADDGEVVLHELGETIATAVDRMQGELARYPSTVGAFVVDELDLSVPVAVKLDRLGQVRTTVIDRAPADETVGQIRLRVRPVLGGRASEAGRLDQPLSVFDELSLESITRLKALRVFSVEDLARLASAPAGAEALAGLGLGVDLAALLGKAALLAHRALPRPVREALVRLGVTSPRAFADHPDPGALAVLLTAELGQEIDMDSVIHWQRLVRDGLKIPLPTTDEP